MDRPMTSLPETMRAWRLPGWGQAPELVEVAVPRPTGSEVLLRVDAAGLCHSDLHLMDAAPGAMPFRPPFTLGHEVVGTAVAGGEALEELPEGRFAVHGIWSCGACRQCLRGRENYCPELTGAIGCGIGRDGGLADYMLVPSVRHLVPTTDGDAADLAPLTDAGLTAFHALRPHRQALAGSVVVVIGIGGLGHLALQLLGDSGVSTVIAVDPRADARALATRLGADHVVSSAADAVDVLTTDECGGADLVLDFVGAPQTMGAADQLLAAGGQVVVVGSAGGTLTVAKGGTLPRGWGVSAPFWGTRDDLAEVVALAERGGLHAETETHPLADAMAAYDRLRSGHVRGRAVVVPTL
jgi:propanol-preferring alcohol dehydrogenase